MSCLGHPVGEDWTAGKQDNLQLNTNHQTASSDEYRTDVSHSRHIVFCLYLSVSRIYLDISFHLILAIQFVIS